MMKQTLLEAVRNDLQAELNRLRHANDQTSLAANSTPVPGSQRDTTGLEASYLASGYARKCSELVKQIGELEHVEVEDFTGQEIDIGALVEVEVDGVAACYFLLNCAGGSEVNIEGRTITVVTPESPLGAVLMGNIEAGLFSFRAGVEGIILRVS